MKFRKFNKSCIRNYENKKGLTLQNFPNVKVNEVILKPGDVLYVPTDWIHYIHSLGVNYQCNTRSGVESKYTRLTNKCKNNKNLMEAPLHPSLNS